MKQQLLMENQRRIQEANQKRMEEMEKKKGEEEKRRKEHSAMLAVRRVIQQVRVAKPDNIDQLKKELETILELELANTGPHSAKIKEEAEKGVEQAGERIEALENIKKQAEERQRLEEEKRKEAEETSRRLVGELDALVSAVETIVNDAQEAVKAARDKGEEIAKGESKPDKAIEFVEEAGSKTDEAKAKLQACSDFIIANGAAMREPHTPKGQTPSENKQHLAKLMSKVNEHKRAIDKVISDVTAVKAKVQEDVKRAKIREKALQKVEKKRAMFQKYDKDKDGLLGKKEIAAYAKGEYGFVLATEALDEVLANSSELGKQGVQFERLQLLKTNIGIAREYAKDAIKRKEREAKEAELKVKRDEIEEEVKQAESVYSEMEEEMTTLETTWQPMHAKAASMNSADMKTLLDEVRETLKEMKEKFADVKKDLERLGESAPDELKAFADGKAKGVQVKGGRFQLRLGRVEGLVGKFESQATEKDAKEMQDIQEAGLATLRYHQSRKDLSNEALFASVNNGEAISEDSFREFFKSCEKRPTTAEQAEQLKEDAEKFKDEKSLATAALHEKLLDEAGIGRLFSRLDEDEDGSLSKEVFIRCIRRFNKVIKETVMTSDISIKGKTMRRLEVGEVVEILEGPKKDPAVGVERVHAKAMKDGALGWVTVLGNQGSSFLEDGGNVFKVLKETIVTSSFQLGAAEDKNTKVKDTTRKLKLGELVEVLEWPTLEEESGLTRMKGRCKTDGVSGWITTQGNQGNVYLEVS